MSYSVFSRPIILPKLPSPAVRLDAIIPNRRRKLGFRVCGVKASMVDSYEGSSNFAKRIEQACNRGRFPVLLVIQMDTWNANGVEVQVSSFLEIICSVKYLRETRPVSYVPERAQSVAPTVKERASVQNGWESLLCQSRSSVFSSCMK
ncbi:hypothetical protein GIB67_014024 [Kingdonia uniflora]|uniref:Uncharacterized protein n=1 Tax=Kingdonia uniflora TaxID=39325 RepID=A0A7J7L5I1_9MAGN|nr:hypothetical protein GIB67_014024 [Kingdonia uniflora]